MILATSSMKSDSISFLCFMKKSLTKRHRRVSLVLSFPQRLTFFFGKRKDVFYASKTTEFLNVSPLNHRFLQQIAFF